MNTPIPPEYNAIEEVDRILGITFHAHQSVNQQFRPNGTIFTPDRDGNPVGLYEEDTSSPIDHILHIRPMRGVIDRWLQKAITLLRGLR